MLMWLTYVLTPTASRNNFALGGHTFITEDVVGRPQSVHACSQPEVYLVNPLLAVGELRFAVH